MRIRLQNGLLPIIVLAVILVIIITLFPSNVLRLIIGLPFIFFFTGYALITALYPHKRAIGGFERVALSLAFSIVVISLVGLILNYTSWGIRLYPVLITLIIFTIIMSVIAWRRQRKMPEADRFVISADIGRILGKGQRSSGKVLSVVLVIVILATIGTLGYVMATPKVGERFTEFYILGAEGKAQAYPKEIALGEVAEVTVGIGNREQETVSYRVELRLDGEKLRELAPVELEPDARWEEPVSFKAERAGDNLKLEFRLFRDGQSEPYLKPLYLWINVK